MDVPHICAHCGHENHRTPKPQPKNPKEAKQINFTCAECNARNLRDGSVIFRKPTSPLTSKEEKNQLSQSPGNPGVLIFIFIATGVGLFISSLLKSNKKAIVKKEDKPTQSPFSYLNAV